MKAILCVLAAMSLPCVAAPALTFSGYSAFASVADQTATFTVDFLKPPRLAATDEVDFWVDPDSADAYMRAESHVFGDLPDSRQTYISSRTVQNTRKLQASWVEDSTTYNGPVGVGGWGAVQGYYSYTLSGSVLSFTVPLSVLQTSSPTFYYDIMVLQSGSAEDGTAFQGVSGKAYSPPFPTPAPVPEPTSAMLTLLGLCGIGFARRHPRGLVRRRALPQARDANRSEMA